MIRQRWKGLVAWAFGATFIVGFLLHDLFSARVAYIAQVVFIVPCILFGGFFILMFMFAYTVPLFSS